MAGIDQIAGNKPTAQFSTQVAEECERLLTMLNDATLRAIALLKFEGYENEEIASRQVCALRTVERKLALIRNLWEQELNR